MADLNVIGGSKQRYTTNAKQDRMTDGLLQKRLIANQYFAHQRRNEARYNKLARSTTGSSQLKINCLGPRTSTKRDLMSDTDDTFNVITAEKRIAS